MSDARITLYRDRLALIGATESGKTGVARHLFEQARCRRVLVDPKHQLIVKGVRPSTSVASIDWRAPLIHVRPPWRDRAFSDDLYGEIFRRLRHALVWTDEADGVSDSSWKGTAFEAIQTQGRELELGHLVLVQRPVGIAREATTEATHTFIFGLIDDDDLKLARRGATFAPLSKLRQLLNELPLHGYVWLDRRARMIRPATPLPPELYRPTLVFKRSER